MPGSMKLLGTDSTFTRATLSAAPQSGPLSGPYRPERRAGFPDWRGVVARAVEPIRGIEKSVKQTLARCVRSPRIRVGARGTASDHAWPAP
jgi:hypothetical protein